MSKFKLLTQADALTAITLLKTDAASVQDRIHLIACSTLDHIRAHGDTRGAVSLLNVLPRGQRVKALAHWYKEFSGDKAVFVEDKPNKTWECKLAKGRNDSDFRIEAAMAMTFADLTTEKDPQSVTIESMLRNLKRQATNTDTHEGTDIPKVSADARDLARAVMKLVVDNGLDKNPRALDVKPANAELPSAEELVKNVA